MLAALNTPFGLFISLYHFIYLRIMPSKPFSEIIWMEMVYVVRIHVQNTDFVIFSLINIRRYFVISVNTHQINIFKTKIICELKTSKSNSAPCVGFLTCIFRKIKPVRITRSRYLIEKYSILCLIQTII